MELSNLKAYELIKQESLDDIQSQGYLLKHKKSGARVVLVENDDNNKVFTIGFRTPPKDSTGLPHILEHSVLCGSKNFPAKDPFVELVKGSLNTFLNAMTYPDKTVYPVASCNDKDFQNLMHVYMDAVFYPNIYQHDEIFRQEGWSYKLESLEDELTYNGVVYNEMKGAFSSPEGVLDRLILNSLFPDTPYAHESGGDPEVIPDLTYQQFIDFHKTYYHPSNSYIYLYGDMDMAEKLDWLDKAYLHDFEAIRVESEIGRQEPFAKMKEIETQYGIANNEPLSENTYLSYNKVVSTSLDAKLYLAFQILDYALLSAPGAPLKKALVDAGIGKDIMGSYDGGIAQPIFSVIAKNAEADQKEAFIKVIEETLAQLVQQGIDKKAIAAGINYHEFRYREADFGNYPKGLMYGLELFNSWLYDDREPFIHLQAVETFEFLKAQAGTGYFEGLIQEWILDNPHGSLVVVVPEQGRVARMDKELAKRLASQKENLSEKQLSELVEKTNELKQYQEEPSDPAALAKIPLLERNDISEDIEPIINQEMKMGDVPFLYHNIETNGIGYVDMMFDLAGVAAKQLPYVGILQSVLGMIDTTNYEYGELFNEINVHTGGIGTSLELYPDVTRVKEKDFKATFEIKGKALYQQIPVVFAMMREIMLESKLTDTKRLKEILDMVKSRLQMRFQSAGHSMAVMRAQSYASPAAKFKDLTSGIAFYEVVKQISEDFAAKKDELVQQLELLTQQIFCKGNMMVSYTAAEAGLVDMEKLTVGLSAELPERAGSETPCVIHCQKLNEGFKTASKVQYVARAGNFIDQGLDYTGALQVLKVILSYDYLWQNIRVKGGAYGCMSNFNKTGEGFLVSYRDPNLEKTNQIYEGVVDYLESFTVSERDMTKYIIGTISNMDQPMTPAAKGERSLNLYMNKVSEESILKERKEILSAAQEDIRQLAKIVKAVLDAGQFCVIGSEIKIEEQAHLFTEVKELF